MSDTEPSESDASSSVEEPTEAEAPRPAKKKPAAKRQLSTGLPAAPRRAASGPRRSFPVAAALAVIFAIVAIIMTVVAVMLNADLDEDRSQRDDIGEIAGQFAEALIAYDYQTLEATKDRVLSLGAEPFNSQYESAFPELVRQLTEAQVQSSATIRDIYVGDVDGGEATAIVATDRTVTSTREGQQEAHQENNVYFRLDLAFIDGDWKVVGVTNLNTALQQTPLEDVLGSDPAGQTGETTPTSAP